MATSRWPTGNVASWPPVTGGGGGGGAQGAQGSQGEPGDTGPTGPQGVPGADGPQGPAGAQGDDGATGPQGDDGATGAQGPQGSDANAETNYYAAFERGQGAVGTVQVLAESGNIANTTDFYGTPATQISQVTAGSMRGAQFYETNGGTNATNGSQFVQFPAFNLKLLDLDQEITVRFDAFGPTNPDEWDAVMVRYDSSFNFIDRIPITGLVANSTCSNVPSQSVVPSYFIGTFTAGGSNLEYYALRLRRLSAGGNVQVDTLYLGPTAYSSTKGETGSQGPQGTPGSAGGTGAQGAPGSAGGTGAQGPTGPQGEPAFYNYIANGTFEGNSVTGWSTYADADQLLPENGTGGTASSTFAATSSSPLRGTYSGLWTKSGTTSRRGEGFSYDFTIAAPDKSKRLQITVELEASAGYAANDMGVYIIADTAGTPVLVYPSIINIPAGASKFIANFNTTTATTYRLVFQTQSISAVDYTLKVDSVTLSANVTAVGAIDQDWTSYTGTSSSWANTNSNYNSKFKRKGDSADFQHYITCTGAGSSTFTMSYAQFFGNSGLTIDTAKLGGMLAGDGMICIGKYSAYDVATQNYNGNVFLNPNTGLIYLGDSDGVGVVTATVPFTFASSDTISIRVDSLPISQFSGSGNIVSGPNVEYAYNTSTSTSGTDSSAYANGPDGAMFYNFTGATKRVQFQYPIQPTDKITLEIYVNGNWKQLTDAALGASVFTRQGAVNFGMGLSTVSGSITLMDVDFGAKRLTDNTTYANNSTATDWSGIASSVNYKWRVRKESGVAATALAEAVPGASDGFVSSNGLKGRTNGVAVPTSYVGQVIQGSTIASSTTLTTSLADIATLALTPGVWQVFWSINVSASCSSAANDQTQVQVFFTNAANTAVKNPSRMLITKSVGSASILLASQMSDSAVINISTSDTHKIRAIRQDDQGTGTGYIYNSATGGSSIYAVRIA